MANPFLTGSFKDIETALLLEKAIQCDLAELNRSYKNAVAFTDGNRVYVNSDDNLARILPDYNQGMLKWLLWHEEYHKQLKHHKRYVKHLYDLRAGEVHDEFHVTKEEVNIIMDILVHDSLAKMFPELTETAVNNLSQMRNRNSLGYTFKTHTLEEMLDEYQAHKRPPEEDDETELTELEGEGEDEGIGDTEVETPDDTVDTEDADDTVDADDTEEGEKTHKDEDSSKDKTEPKSEPEHDKTDWSKLEDIDTREFIDIDEANRLDSAIKELKNKKLKLAKVTETLNGLVTTTRVRTYARPSYIGVEKGVMFKGRKPGRASLYLVFDASGSMGRELALFKKIISESIPQAMNTPTEWFSGRGEKISPNPKGKDSDYYKGTFKDIMPVLACSGYCDDGDRVIELCLEAEKQGYSPIGVTDGGGGISAPEVLKQLKRTVLVGNYKPWLLKAKEINPRIEIIDI